MTSNEEEKKGKVRYSVYLPKRTNDALKELIEKTEKTANELIGEALDDFLEVLGKEDIRRLDRAELRRRLSNHLEDED